MDGTPRYASRWAWSFQQNVPTLSLSPMPEFAEGLGESLRVGGDLGEGGPDRSPG